MNHIIKIDEALNKKCSFIDVRTYTEFKEGTIPGAINIPILTEEERELVSKAYIKCKRDGFSLGLKYAGNKLNHYYDFLSNMEPNTGPVIFFCWRGGMRSKGITQIMNLMKINCYQLMGGYKAYRRYIVAKTPELLKDKSAIVIHGLTGSGKTEILNHLTNKYKMPIIDIEKLANNKGSIFGDINMGSPNSQKTFDSLLFNQLMLCRKYPFIILESESPRIGNVYLPNPLVNIMEKGVHILVVTTFETRVKRLIRDYEIGYKNNPDIIEKRIETLSKKLGKTKVNDLKLILKKGNIRTFIELLLKDYYDPLYNFSLQKIQEFTLIVDGENTETSADKIFAYIQSYY